MPWLPGWDLLTSVARWHEICWWLGIACFVLLVGSEILARFTQIGKTNCSPPAPARCPNSRNNEESRWTIVARSTW
jgi:hypothetical protein